MGCACFKQDVVVNKNVRSSRNTEEVSKNVNINIRIEQREINPPQVVNNRPSTNTVNNNDRVRDNRNSRPHNRASENISNILPNEPYLQSKNNPNFNMPEVGNT